MEIVALQRLVIDMVWIGILQGGAYSCSEGRVSVGGGQGDHQLWPNFNLRLLAQPCCPELCGSAAGHTSLVEMKATGKIV